MRRCITVAVALAALTACSSGTKQASSQKASIATAAAGDLTVELLTDARLETGTTRIYLRVRDGAGQPITDAAVTFQPTMTMTGSMAHGAPVLGSPTVGADGLYGVRVVFQMPTSDIGSWSAVVGVTRPGAATLEASFPALDVADSGRAKSFSYTEPGASTATKYVASLNLEAEPKVGLNPVVVTLHRMEDMMTFVPVDDAAIALDPQMPSMGHGSPGSVDPTLTSAGDYEGQLSFAMAGEWLTTVTFSRGGAVIGAPQFAIAF